MGEKVNNLSHGGVDTTVDISELDVRDKSIMELKEELSKVQKDMKEYRLRCSKQKERLDHLERMSKEHEALYVQFLVKSIKAERDKRILERRLARINYIIQCVSQIQCSKVCLNSWMNPQEFTWQRGVILASAIAFSILFICLVFAD